MPKLPKFFIKVILSLAVFLIFYSYAQAASVYFDVEDREVGTTGPFTVKVFLDSALPVNAVTVVLDLPPSVELVDYSDGNSVINLWVERPAQKDNQLSFSGLIPGGFQGQDAKLIELNLKTDKAGPISIGVNAASIAYQNNAEATAEKVTGKVLVLTAVSGKENISMLDEDTVDPESFKPEIVQLETESGLFWAVAFTTQDKGTGIESYEVLESKKKFDITESEINEQSWEEAQSPHILKDQKLKSYIYILATDKGGNKAIEVISPQKAWYKKGIGYIIILVIILGLYVLASRKNK